MKTAHHRRDSKGKSGNSQSNRRGVALVMVLTVMALATIMILTFFGLATSENRASATYSRGLQAQQVAEQAVNIVIAQIRKATSDPNIAWASQPGAIRTWTRSGEFHAGFKLYSDDLLEEPDQFKLNEEDFNEAKGWVSLPNEFVDLNEPVIRVDPDQPSKGKAFFPIVDPLARDKPKWTTRIGEDSDDAGVEGFEFNFTENLTITPGPWTAQVSQLENYNSVGHLALPVRWIYQLADGTLGVLQGDNFQPFGAGSIPTRENQIVARFAYWADDETAKLNLNTHSGGLSWDTPRCGGKMDMEMGKFQPAQHEWQRYPGHPATVHLSPALAPGVTDIVRNKAAMEIIFSIVPRVVGGGSESGTRKASNAQEWVDPGENGGKAKAPLSDGLTADANPLYPSLDEYFLNPNRTTNRFPQAHGIPAPEDEMQEIMERLRFFLTVTSRAPETTLFNTPKIAIWPIHNIDDDDHRTPFDRLIAFCSTVGDGHEYFFKRENEDSQTYDYQQIDRNQELYDFLDKYTSTPIPGVGKAFSDKYSTADRLQLLTQIFDFVRCTNLHDDTLFRDDWKDAFRSDNTDNHITYTNPRGTSSRGVHKGHGQVTPIRISKSGVDTQGFGRFYTLKDMAIIVICGGRGPRLEVVEDILPGSFNSTGYSAGQWRELLGGVTTDLESQGYSVYRQGDIGAIQSTGVYSNLPPLNVEARIPDNADREQNQDAFWQAIDNVDPANYPQWLTDFLDRHDEFWARFYQPIMNSPADHDWKKWRDWKNAPKAKQDDYKKHWENHARMTIDIAFEPENWNFNLLYRSPDYPDLDSNGWVTESHLDYEEDNGLQALPEDVKLGVDENLLQAGLVWHLFCPMMGWVPINPDLSMRISMDARNSDGWFEAVDPKLGGNKRSFFLCNYDALGNELPGSEKSEREWWYANNRANAGWRDKHAGGVKPLGFFLSAEHGQSGRQTPLDPGYRNWRGGSPDKPYNCFHWVTAPFTVYAPGDNDSERKFTCYGGEVNVEIYTHGDKNMSSAPSADPALIQTIQLDFGEFTAPLPNLANGSKGYINEFNAISYQPQLPQSSWSLGYQGAHTRVGYFGSDRNRSFKTDERAGGGRMHRVDNGHNNIFHGADVVRSIGVLHADMRMTAARINTTTNEVADNGLGWFGPHHNYENEDVRMAHDMSLTTGDRLAGADGANSAYRHMRMIPGLGFTSGGQRRLPAGMIGDPNIYRSSLVQKYGDFDNGMGLLVDGPYINKPDEGNTHSLYKRTWTNQMNAWDLRRDYGDFPYFVRDYIHEAGSPAYFSPNRIVNGPGMFGSLPTGVQSNQPWQTLLFRPESSSGHPGAQDPKDHYIMDLFWMPVVEPYAISDTFSTAGRINLNYQMLPFRHVKRSTAMRGVLRSEMMVLIPTPGYRKSDSEGDLAYNNSGDHRRKGPSMYTKSYKHHAGRGIGYHWRDAPFGGYLQKKRLRGIILEERTLEGFQKRFDSGEIFKSASEVCEMHLIQQQMSERFSASYPGTEKLETYTPELEDMESGKFWRDHVAVGDNSRERPYANIYQRTTTRSNTFKVHYRAQVLKQGIRIDDGNYARFDAELDSVVAEYRGSSIIERYINPNDSRIPDYATASNPPSIGEFYRYRIINPTRFAP